MSQTVQVRAIRNDKVKEAFYFLESDPNPSQVDIEQEVNRKHGLKKSLQTFQITIIVGL